RRAGRHRVSDGAGRRRPRPDDPPSQSDRRDRRRRLRETTMQTTFIVHVEDQPGVLTRVTSLIRRRGFNIESLTVGHTERAGVSPESLIIEITGTEDKVDGLVEMLRPYGVLEMARTGRVAMSRGASAAGLAADAAPDKAIELDSGVSFSV